MKIAVLDDYTGWVSRYPKWERVSAIGEVVFFSDHLTGEDALVDRLNSFDVIVIERERTPFPRGLLQRLPRLRLLASTGLLILPLPRNSASLFPALPVLMTRLLN